jgi:hypothetical protein
MRKMQRRSELLLMGYSIPLVIVAYGKVMMVLFCGSYKPMIWGLLNYQFEGA